MHDLVIRNATVIDGTGAPGVRADVAADDGLISIVGEVGDAGREEIDARGHIVTPGFVDVHTHYDGQATWDPLLAPSIWHGVTTVVMGNCGVGFAPAAPDRHDWLIGLMEGVEGIPGASLREGIDWAWETVAEYLDALDVLPHATDIAAQIPHGAVRAFVMGERGAANEQATPDDIAQMAAVVEAGVAAGAVGLSVNRLEMHRAVDGREVPGTFAELDEIFALARAMAAGSSDAVFSIILPMGSAADRLVWDREIDWLGRLSRETGAAVMFPFVATSDGSDQWRDRLAGIERANAAGARLVPQVASHRQGLLCGLRTMHPFQGRPTFEAMTGLPLEERARRMADPATKSRILAERAPRGSAQLLPLLVAETAAVFPSAPIPELEPDPDSSLAATVAATGRDPVELLYDWSIADEGRALVHFFLGGYPGNLDASLDLLAHPQSVLGLGDGGAHVDIICDASYPSHVLSYWARDRARGSFSIETAVRILSSEPARLFEMHDRGVVARGLRADLNVIEPDKVSLHPMEIVRDLPAGAKRVLQRADGYVATVVSGQVVQRGGSDTGARPGRVVRSAAAR